MKICKMFTTTLFTITLLATFSLSFGMSQDPNDGKKPKGLDHLPSNIEEHRQARRLYHQKKGLKVEDFDLQLHNNCYQLPANIDTLLSEYGADPNYQGEIGHTALHLAVTSRGACQTVQSLLQWKADPNVKNNRCLTPLHTATMFDNDLAIDLLLAAKADANLQDSDSYTPIHYLHKEDTLSPLVYFRHGAFSVPNNPSVFDILSFKKLKKALRKDERIQKEYAEYRTMLQKSVQETLTTVPTALVAVMIDYFPTSYKSFSDLPATSQFSGILKIKKNGAKTKAS